MKSPRSVFRSRWIIWVVACALPIGALPTDAEAQNRTLRVVTYNIEADIDGVTTPRAGLYDVLKGIGTQMVVDNFQPLDILALQETTSNSVTVSPIVTALNSYYGGAAVYAQSTLQGTQVGGNANGNGPNALVYNTSTLQLIASAGIGTPTGSNNGMYRQVMRYTFRPVGGTASNNFYVYVTHMKSSATGDLFVNETHRNNEAIMIRNNAATLVTATNPNPAVLYVGDFNFSGSALITSGTQSISAYQTMTSSAATAQTRAIDPLNANPQNNNQTWYNNSAFRSIMTASSTAVHYRADLQMMTPTVYNGTAPLGLKYVPGSLHTFGNNGSISLFSSVTSSSNTALNDLIPNPPISRATLLSSLTTASDHLPVVADYRILVPLLGDLTLDGIRTSADIAAMLGALKDVNAFKSTRSLTDADLLAIGDVNGDHALGNADLQSLLNLLKSGAGAQSVPEPSALILSVIAGLFVSLWRLRFVATHRLSGICFGRGTRCFKLISSNGSQAK